MESRFPSPEATEYLEERRDRLLREDNIRSWRVSASVKRDGPGTGGSGAEGGNDGGGLKDDGGSGGRCDGGEGKESMSMGRCGLRAAMMISRSGEG